MLKKREDGDISFLGKVFLLVRNLFEKIKELHLPHKFIAHEKSIAGYEGENSPKEAKISYILGVTRAASLTLLCLLLIAALLIGGSIFSFNNVYYMFKDISYISSFSENRPDTLSYSRPFANQDFAIFKDGLSVAGDGEIKLFTSTGRATMIQGSEFTNPKICASDSTVLIYDQGRRTFKVYNSFVSIYSETLDYPISSAHMAPDGSFCIVTKSDSYGSVVRVYDNKQRLESEFHRNDYIISVAMSQNGKTLAVVSLDSAEGKSIATLTVLERGKSKTKSSAEITDFLPYIATFTDNDRVAIIGSDSAYVYNLNGNCQSSYEYSGRLVDMSVSDSGYALLFSDVTVDSDYTLSVFGSNGNHVGSYKVRGRVTDIALNGNFAYLLADGEVRRMDTLFGTTLRLETAVENAELLVLANGDILACTDTAAYYLSFK